MCNLYTIRRTRSDDLVVHLPRHPAAGVREQRQAREQARRRLSRLPERFVQYVPQGGLALEALRVTVAPEDLAEVGRELERLGRR